ncbi:MAG: TrkA family potassium uptake protein [Haloferacaceae archaeon]
MPVDNRVVIAGGGRVGLQVATLLEEYGHTPIVIEADEDRCGKIGEHHVSMLINGDATNPEILTQATIERSDAVAAVTGDGGTNIAVCDHARDIAPRIRTIARADTAEAADQESHEEFIDTVIYPEHAGARLVLTHLLGEGFEQFAALSEGIEVIVIEVTETAPAAGKRVSKLALPVGSRLIADVTRSVIVTDETKIEPGNQYLVGLDRGVADEVQRLFTG